MRSPAEDPTAPDSAPSPGSRTASHAAAPTPHPPPPHPPTRVPVSLTSRHEEPPAHPDHPLPEPHLPTEHVIQAVHVVRMRRQDVTGRQVHPHDAEPRLPRLAERHQRPQPVPPHRGELRV